jgi:hypothetical protein
MRIFLSYASEERDTVERAHYALVARGHDVFFDREDLPAGQEYDAAIGKAIDACDLFVFLITPASVETGRYTLTELRLASARWPHPGGVVLPVLLRPTEHDAIPAYLRAVNILEPQGNVAAEIADAVERLVEARAATRRRRAAAATAALVSLLLVGAFAWTRWGINPPPAVSARDPLLGTPLPDAIGSQARGVAGVASATGGYVVALATKTLVSMTDDHQPIGTTVSLPGEPIDVVQMPTQLFVVTRSPTAVVVLNRRDLSPVETIPAPPSAVEGQSKESEIQSVTPAASNTVWAISRGSDGASLSKYYVRGWRLPKWMAGRFASAADLTLLPCHRLKTIAGAPFVFAAACKKDASLYRIEGAIRVDELAAADYPMLGCLVDIAERTSRHLLILGCDGRLHEASLDGPSRLVPERVISTLSLTEDSEVAVDGRIVTDGRDVFVAMTTHASNTSTLRPPRVRIGRVEGDRAIEIGRFPDASLVSLAVSPRWVIVVLKHQDGGFTAAALPRHASTH